MRKPVEATMRAVVLDGKVRFTRSYPAPAPVAGECLIRVLAAGVCSTDLELAKGYMSFTGVIGHEFVGRVEDAPEAGLVGSRVVCEINCVCGQCDLCQAGLRNHCRNRTAIGISGRDGCFADLITVPQRNCFRVPDSIDDEQAVFVEPLAAAVQVIKQVPVDSETKATVLGDGRLGLLVAQVLQSAGVANLTLVGRHEHKLAIAAQRGIRTVELDSGATVAGAADLNHSQDLVVDCTGKPAGLAAALEFVRPRGVVVLKSTYADPGAVNLAPLVINEVQVIGSRCGPFPDAIDLLARKQVDVTGLISKRFKLDRATDALDAAGKPENVKVLLTLAG